MMMQAKFRVIRGMDDTEGMHAAIAALMPVIAEGCAKSPSVATTLLVSLADHVLQSAGCSAAESIDELRHHLDHLHTAYVGVGRIKEPT